MLLKLSNSALNSVFREEHYAVLFSFIAYDLLELYDKSVYFKQF